MRIVYTEIDVDAIADDWETLTSAGIEIAAAHDRNRWALGDLALRVERRYGQESLKAFAGAVKIRPKTLYDYASCSRFYNKQQRDAYPNLTWSHYRAALRDSDNALRWLDEASAQDWSVDDLTAAIRASKGGPSSEKIAEAYAICVASQEKHSMRATELVLLVDSEPAIPLYQKLKVVIYRLKD